MMLRKKVLFGTKNYHCRRIATLTGVTVSDRACTSHLIKYHSKLRINSDKYFNLCIPSIQQPKNIVDYCSTVRGMSNLLIHLVIQHVYVWMFPLMTIAAIRRAFWQDGAKYLCRAFPSLIAIREGGKFRTTVLFWKREEANLAKLRELNTMLLDSRGWFYLSSLSISLNLSFPCFMKVKTNIMMFWKRWDII